MPYSSDAQRRWAHTNSAKKAGFPTDEFDKASKGKKLPERVKKMAGGGVVSPYPDNKQMIEETNEERHPEANDPEFMADGGEVSALEQLLEAPKLNPATENQPVGSVGEFNVGIQTNPKDNFFSEVGKETTNGVNHDLDAVKEFLMKMYNSKGIPEAGSTLGTDTTGLQGIANRAAQGYAGGGTVTTPHREKSGPSINTTPEHKYADGGPVDSGDISPLESAWDTLTNPLKRVGSAIAGGVSGINSGIQDFAHGITTPPNQRVASLANSLTPKNSTQTHAPIDINSAPPATAPLQFNPLASHPASYPQPAAQPMAQPGPMDALAPQGGGISDYLAQQKASMGKYGPEQQLAVSNDILRRQNSPGSLVGQGLAGLGDAIMQGVARAGNPGFLKGVQERQQAQGQQQIGAMERAGTQQVEQTKANMALDVLDPNSALSQSKREQMEAPLAAMGLNPKVIAKMSAGEMDNAMNMLKDLSIKDREIAVKRLEMQIKIKEVLEQQRHNVSEEGLKGTEIRTGATEKLANMPAATRLENKIPGSIGGAAQKNLEQTAGLNQLTPEDHTAIQWAQSNPTDPRSAKILQLHGIQ